jgi:hypothetical protein
MEYDILYSGMNVCLINCFLDREKLTYGFGYFAANTPPQILLRDGDGRDIVKVAVPDEIVINPIMEVMGDAHDTNVLMRVFDSAI